MNPQPHDHHRRGALARACAALMLAALAATAALADEPGDLVPPFAEPFWQHWGDGQAELAGYQLRINRYGQLRHGTAVAIFVTETFSDDLRVKAESQRPRPDDSETFPVMKLNLVQDFQTGVYDYNLMTSVFVALEARGGRPAGSATKVSFSSQEWCGHVYQQALFDADQVRQTLHSYFEGEADDAGVLAYPGDGMSEDALLLWARGLAWPRLEPGEKRSVALLRSLQDSRLRHQQLAWRPATLEHERARQTITVPAGRFEVAVRTCTVADEDQNTWTFHVEHAHPHRLIKWTRSDGYSGELLGSERMQYWRLQREGDEARLRALGLAPPRTMQPTRE